MTGRNSGSTDRLRAQFGKNAKALRALQDISQEELAYLTSLHRTEVGLLERGVRLPRLDTILKLAAGLEATPDEMLAGMTWSPGRYEPGSFLVTEVPDLGRGAITTKEASRPGSPEQ